MRLFYLPRAHCTQANPVLVDLHTHTSASDGALTPAELLGLLAAAGVVLGAFTDHDTLAGWDQIAARPARGAEPPRLLPGIEFSADAAGREIHVVGLGFDPGHPVLRGAVASQQTRRRERAERIAARLEYLGVRGALAGAEAAAGGAGLGRPHFARFLVACGRVRTEEEAFHRYLGKGKPAACRMHWPELAEVIGWIRAAGGRAVLAHPLAYRLSGTKLRALVEQFRACGGDAVEVALPGLAPAELELIGQLTRAAGLRASAGSDFHTAEGWNTPARIPPLPPWLDPLWSEWI
jgi:3',5'-nucleoside bisphosphate phosphatase